MSVKAKKRSRKSKLVPRHCTEESEDDDVDLQTWANKVPRNMEQQSMEENNTNVPTSSKSSVYVRNMKNNVNSEMKNAQSSSAPIQFNIKVEVEKYDEYIKQEIGASNNNETSAENIVIVHTQGSMLNSVKNYPKRMKKKAKPSLSYLNKKKVGTHSFKLTNTKILDAAQEIMNKSTNIADKILDIAVRNMTGHVTKGIQYIYLHEEAVQEVLDEWRAWQFRSFHRESPLFYKCYVCNLSWWYLTEFREHIQQHSKLKIALEHYERHEANMIAYSETWPLVKDIYTQGPCGKCGDNFDAHRLSLRIQKKYYSDAGCSKIFFTCTSLKFHVASCSQCKTTDKHVKCEICKLLFKTEEMLHQHLQITHSVRSDVPILCRYKICKECQARYVFLNQHICGQKGPHFKCTTCFRNFSCRHLTELHMEYSGGPYNCEVCGEQLKWDCMKYEHMMMHTDNYVIANKCVKCEDFNVYLSYHSGMVHRYEDHNEKDTKHQSYFVKIIIPKACIDQIQEESESVTENALPPIPESETKNASAPIPESETKNASAPIPESETKNALSPIPESKSVPECLNRDIKIKSEPEDIEDIEPLLDIKEEPIGELDYNIDECTDPNEAATEYKAPELNIKQEYDDCDSDEYEEDIIKLDFGIIDHSIKEEPTDMLLESKFSQEFSETPDWSQESIQTRDCSLESIETPDCSQESIETNQESIIIEQEQVHDIVRTKRKRLYTCTNCGYRAKHRDYKEHIETECRKSFAKVRSLVCSKCNLEFPSMKKYLQHFVNHGYDKLSCPTCQKQFYSFTRLTPHVQAHVKQNFVRVKLITIEGSNRRPEYQCKTCNEVVHVDDFFEHWELHVSDSPQELATLPSVTKNIPKLSGQANQTEIDELISRLQKKYKECNKCQRQFNRLNECKRHLIEHLLTDAYMNKMKYEELRCQMCGNGYPNAEKYKEHMRDHASLPVYKCEMCDKSFSDSSNFTKHKKVHNLKVLVCDLCGKKFQTKLSLEKHLELHKVSKPVTCFPCNKVFHFESTYRKHIKNYHERNSGFRCMMCDLRFSSLKLKWNHMWEIHKERKHKADCPICSKSFRKYSDVRAHARQDHNAEVSVNRVKSHSENIDYQKLFKSRRGFRLGERETLIIYE